jgi:K+-sensing histidine kinase KdpD
LFSRYYRAEGAKKQPGVGLGLWLSQNLALKLGSAIEVQVDAVAIEFSFEVGQRE